MLLLIAGVFVFAGIHALPLLDLSLRTRLRTRMGNNGYRGLFSLFVIAGVVLMVLGWKSATPVYIYSLPTWASHMTLVIMAAAFILFVAARAPTNLRRFIRHPQLMSVLLWSLAHLLVRGDSRSLVLFGGLAVWALLAMHASNRRDGGWIKPGPVSPVGDVITIVLGLAVFTGFAFIHEWLFGVSPLYLLGL